MPLYEYECEACGKRFELIRKFSEAALDECPKCSKGPVRRLASSPAIQFKGTGWYITDYARKDSAGSETSSSTKKSSEKGDEKGGDTAATASSTEASSSKTETSAAKTESTAPAPAAKSSRSEK